MPSLLELPALDPETGLVNAVVDTPRGSRNKYKLDERSGQWRLTKMLPEGMAFPYDFGFIPSTRQEDGDPIDILILGTPGSVVGCVVPARLIGVLVAEQTEGRKTVRNDRLVGVVETRYNPAEYGRLSDVPEQRLSEVEQFFVSYNRVEGREFRPLERGGPDRARSLLDAAIELARRGAAPKKRSGKSSPDRKSAARKRRPGKAK